MSALTKCKGLHTFANKLSEIPEGALLEADNVVIDRDGIIEPRRGFKLYGSAMPSSNDRAKQLLVYKDRILRHFGSTLQFDNSGTFSSFSGSYTEPGLRMKGVEVNGNFYFTTDNGIKKISAATASDFTTASGYITSAGGVKALDLNAYIKYDAAGFMAEKSKVAYRVLWSKYDLNNNLISGVPSSRTVISNISTTLLANVELSFTIPDDVTDITHFYQIYRTAVREAGALSLDEIDPGDEMNLVYEAYVTPTDLSNGSITVTDIMPDDFRVGGLPLYTNPVSGDGILQANEKPPMAADIALFKDHTFYANTSTYHRLTFNILGLNGFTSGTSKIIVTDGTLTRRYTFVGENEIATIKCDTFANTTASSYILLYSASDERGYYFWFDKTGTDTEPSAVDTEGKIGVRVNINGLVSAIDVAGALATAINSVDDFDAVNSGTDTATVTWVKNGNVTDTAFGLTAPGGVFAITTTQQGDGEEANTAGGGDVLLSSLASPSQAVDETARSLVRIINEDNTGIVSAFYLSGPDDLPGNILLERRSLNENAFYVGVDDSAITERFNPSLPLRYDATTTMANPTVATTPSHGLTTGDQIIAFGSTTSPSIAGQYTVTVLDANTFTIPVNVTVSGAFEYFLSGVASSNETVGNRVYYSKAQQPEAVPLLNYFSVGARDKEIKRIISLRDSLFIFKEDAIYRVVGYGGNFSSDLFDSSATIIAPDSAAVLNNQIYVLTSQGVVVITDTGVGIVSRAIENDLTKIAQYTDFSSITFAATYETDRAYLLWTQTKNSDTVATQCFRYNVFTKTWTKWLVKATCAAVNSVIYIGASDTNYLEKERKDFVIGDYADRELDVSIITNKVSDKTVILSSLSGIATGDVIVQVQRVTIAKFNRLLKRLDLDTFVSDTDYYSTLALSPGNVIHTNLALLAQKLDADSGVTFTNYFSSISGATTQAGIQSDFNIIVNKLNLDPGVKYSDYSLSTGTLTYQSVIDELSASITAVITEDALPLISGDAIVVKKISSNVVWAPTHFQAPDQYKQIREGTVIFERDSFTRASVAYKSDLSQSYETIEFEKTGTGEFGTFTFGESNFGGDGAETPIRTLIPRSKQRCRYITCKFNHAVALEKYAILGISYEARAYSSRAYR